MKQNTNEAVYDARTFGVPKMMILGFQHMFAMFGATVLVPALTGLSVSATLLFAGLGTLLFHFLTKGKVPAFLGSSFAYLAGYAAIAPNGEKELLPYACAGVACSALLYFILAGLIKAFSVERVMKFFPPIVTGPIIIAIGLTLSSSAISNCSADWLVAIVAIVIVVVCNIWGKGMIKIIPIILGVLGSYAVGILRQDVDFTAIRDAAWIGLPFQGSDTVFSIFQNLDSGLLINAIITIMPIALATMVEHIGDICAISSTVGKNYIKDPGLHRTLLGDGAATFLASLFGAPANTTYGENTGVLAVTKVYDPAVLRIAACYAIVLGFLGKFGVMLQTIPTPVMGGVSIILFGMISAVGARTIVDAQLDFSNSRNLIIASLILVFGIAINEIAIWGTISISGLAIAALVGVILNKILPEDQPYSKKQLKKMKEQEMKEKR